MVLWGRPRTFLFSPGLKKNRKGFPSHYKPERDEDFIFKGDSHYYVFRLALCVGAEYFQSEWQGNVEKVHEFWDDIEKYLNEMYGRDCGIQFDLIKDDKLILKTDPTYTSEGTRVINELIGSDRYELGLILRPSDRVGGSAFLDGVYSQANKANGFATFAHGYSSIAHEIGHLLGAEHTHEGGGGIVTEKGGGCSIMSYGSPRTFFSLASIRQIRTTLLALGYYSDASRTTRVGGNPEYTNIPYARPVDAKIPVLNRGQIKKEYVVTKGTRFQFYIPTQDDDSRDCYYSAHPYDPRGGSAAFMQRLYAPTHEPVVMFHPRYEKPREVYKNGGRGYEHNILTHSDDYATGTYTYMLSASRKGRHDVFKTRLRVVEGERFAITEYKHSTGYSYEGRAGETKIKISWNPCRQLYGDDSRVRILLSDDFGQSFKYVLADGLPNDGHWEGVAPYHKIGRVSYGNLKEQIRGGVIKVEVIGEAAYALSQERPYGLRGTSVLYTGGFDLQESRISFSPTPPIYVELQATDPLPVPQTLTASNGSSRQSVQSKDETQGNTTYRRWVATMGGKTVTYTQVITRKEATDPNLAARNRASYLALQMNNIYKHIGQLGYPKSQLQVSQHFKQEYAKVFDAEGRVRSNAQEANIDRLEGFLQQMGELPESDIVMPQHGHHYKIASYHESVEPARRYFLQVNGGDDEHLLLNNPEAATVWLCQKVGDAYLFSANGTALYLHYTAKQGETMKLMRGYTWGAFSFISATDYPYIAQVDAQGRQITRGTPFQDHFTPDMKVNGKGFSLSTDFQLFPQEQAYTNEGEGTQENPYTAADAKHLAQSNSPVWIKGTILGEWRATGQATQPLKQVLALGDGDEAIPVHLPSSAIEGARNMQGQTLSVCGTIASYAGGVGMSEGAVTALDYGESLSITAAGHATYCCPYPMIVPEGLEAAVVQQRQGATLRCDWESIPAGTLLPAATPILLRGQPGDYPVQTSLAQAKALVQPNLLQGTLTALVLNNSAWHYYKLAEGPKGLGFYHDMQGSHRLQLTARKAYLAFSSAAGMPPRLSWEGAIPTALEQPALASSSDLPVLDLTGRKVGTLSDWEQLPAGVYIVQGQKCLK